MKPLLRLPLPLVALLAAAPALAVTDTWDGNAPNAGAGDSNISTGLNWADDTAPVSSLITADLIFAGTTKLTPNFSVGFSAGSITFNNTAGAFSLGGQALGLGAGGIVNNDTQAQTFTNQISVQATPISFNAASGPLVFANSVFTVGNTITLDGANAFTFANIGGSGAVTKSGAGAMSWAPTTTSSIDIAINTGTVSTVADASTDVFDSGASIAVNNTSTLNINESMTLDGALLTRATGAALALAAGKTLTVQNGGDAIITGLLNHATASTIAVTGSGSTLTTGQLALFGGSTLNVAAGGAVSSGSNPITLGAAGGNGTASVDGNASSLGGGSLNVGSAGVNGLLTFSNGSSGAFGAISVDNSIAVGTSGTLSIQSGATVSGTSLTLASQGAANTGTVTINGAGSALTITGTGTANIGAASASTGTLNVQNSGAFNSGTFTSTVNTTGTVNITGGTFNQNGNLIMNGQLTRDAAGLFTLAAGRTLTVQNGGDFLVSGTYLHTTASTISVTGAGSTWNTGQDSQWRGGAVLNVLSGGAVSAINGLHLASVNSGGNATLTVDGAGSNFTVLNLSGGTTWGATGTTAAVTVSGGATSDFGLLTMAPNGGTASLLVNSSATVSTGSVQLAKSAGGTGTITVNGSGSVLSILGATGLTAGGTTSTLAQVRAESGGTLHTGTSTAHVTGANSSIQIVAGTWLADGSTIFDSGAQFTRDGTGTFTPGLGTTLTMQGGSDAVITGSFQNLTRSNLNVTGSGSTFSTTGDFQWEGGSSTLALLSVVGGGTLSSSGALHLAKINTAVSLTANGAGSLITASPASTSEWQAGVLLLNGATASLGGLRLADVDFGSTSFGSLAVQSGSQMSVGNLAIASTTASATGALTVDGPGSAVTQTGASTFKLGAGFLSSATLDVNNGGTFTSGTGAVTLNATGTINIGGGTLSLNGPLTDNGGTVNFTSGALNIISNFKVGTGGLLGDGDFTVPASKRFTTTAATTIDAFRTLTLDGGLLSTATLTNNGSLAFHSGTLAVTGAGGFNIAGSGALGSNVTLSAGANLQVTQNTGLAGGAALTLAGGSLPSDK